MCTANTCWAARRAAPRRQRAAAAASLPPSLGGHPSPQRASCPADFSIKLMEWNDGSELIPQTMALRKQNPSIKILLAIGGW